MKILAKQDSVSHKPIVRLFWVQRLRGSAIHIAGKIIELAGKNVV